MRHVYLALIVAGMLLASASSVPAQSAAEARRALASGRTADAIQLADAVLQQTPADREGTDVKIRAMVSIGDMAGARGAYERYLNATGREDAQLLEPVALEELRRVASGAAGDARLRLAALEPLARSGDRASLGEIRDVSDRQAGTGAAVLADAALARLRVAGASERLAAAVSSPRIRDKSIVAEAIGAAGATDQAAALVALLHEQSPATRAAAADVLGKFGYGPAVPELRASLSDEDPTVRAHAALALKRLGDHAGDAMVAAMLKSPAPDARLAALEVTPSVGFAERQQIIMAATQDADGANRVKGAIALAHDDPFTARSIILTALDDPDAAVRAQAERALENLGTSDLAQLRPLMGHASGWVRAYAAGGVLSAARTK